MFSEERAVTAMTEVIHFLWGSLNSLEPRDLVLLILFLLGGVVIVITSAYLFFKIHDIQKKRFAEVMTYVETKLRSDAILMYDRIASVASSRFKDAPCEADVKNCGQLRLNLEQQLAIADFMIRDVFEEKSRRTVKTRIRQNGFYKKKGADLKRYKTTVATKIYNDNVDLFVAKGINRYPLIAIRDRGAFYSIEDAIKLYSDIIDRAILIRKREKAEILQTVFGIRRFFAHGFDFEEDIS